MGSNIDYKPFLMKKIFISLCLLSFLGCVTQKNVTQIAPTKYINTINADDLKTYLDTLASDEMAGRETGSEGQKKAGLYMINHYKINQIPAAIGAANYYQKVPSAFMEKQNHEILPDSENICAFIEGSELPNEILVISAHYDHIGIKNNEIYNGADDNGSGTAALLSIAKAFAVAKKEGNGPKRSILFLHVTGEEHGLYGSKFYAENPLFPLKNTIADINIDMIGRRDEKHSKSNNYIYLIGSDFLSTDLYESCEIANKKYVNLEIDYTYNSKSDPNRYYYRSDHYNFAKNGIPVVFLFNGVHADYHQASDEVDKIEFDALAKRTQLGFAIAWDLANRKKRPFVDKKG